jgi:hypothetical protein
MKTLLLERRHHDAREKGPSTTTRKFLVTLLVSSVVGVVFWNFGLANKTWPAHSFFTAVALAAICGSVFQLVLTHGNASNKD